MIKHGMKPLASRADRYAAGKARRDACPRESHAPLALPARRDTLAVLAEQDRTRIAELVPVRRKRMAHSAFCFLRGAAAIMAVDLASQPMAGLSVQASGDCHLMNFGALQSPEGHILFDINDFDETLAGIDFTVDVKRLAASIAVAGRDAQLGPRKIETVIAGAVRSYRRMVRKLADMAPLEIWQQRIDLDIELDKIGGRRLQEHIRRLLTEPDANDDVPHLDTEADPPRFQDRDGKIYHKGQGVAPLIAEARQALEAYPQSLQPDRRALMLRYRLMDVAIKVVGVGSVGTLCAIGLYGTADDDFIVLQIKEAKQPVLLPLLPDLTQPMDNGRRVVEGQRAMQAASDPFLGWTQATATGRPFYVRHLKNQRLNSLTDLVAEDFGEGDCLAAYANLCAHTLARAHARTGDAAGIAGYLGSSDAFDTAVAEFALAYADVTAQDWARLVAAQPS